MILRRLLAALLVLGAVFAPGLVAAHEMTIAELELRETALGEFFWQWAASSDNLPAAEDLTPRWPGDCVAQANALRCGKDGLRGSLSIDGVGKRYSATLVKVFWRDGRHSVYTITGSQPRLQLYGSADDPRGALEISRAYTVLGFEHILSGYDHLLFVFSLLFLVGFGRKLVWTITAFTAAHSLTLASAALGVLTLRPPPVEASIALSIVLVAGEALHKRETFARRWPAIVAFLFGLVHGLGFAGALQEVGLPAKHLPAALLTFNVGVELGQLFILGAAWMIWQGIKRQAWALKARTPLLYGIGVVAAYWSIQRISAILA